MVWEGQKPYILYSVPKSKKYIAAHFTVIFSMNILLLSPTVEEGVEAAAAGQEEESAETGLFILVSKPNNITL